MRAAKQRVSTIQTVFDRFPQIALVDLRGVVCRQNIMLAGADLVAIEGKELDKAFARKLRLFFHALDPIHYFRISDFAFGFGF